MMWFEILLDVPSVSNSASVCPGGYAHQNPTTSPVQHCSSPKDAAISLRSRESAGMGVFLPLFAVWLEYMSKDLEIECTECSRKYPNASRACSSRMLCSNVLRLCRNSMTVFV